jgi:hypothetical protein
VQETGGGLDRLAHVGLGVIEIDVLLAVQPAELLGSRRALVQLLR